MFKLFVYVFVITLTLFGVYAFVPESGFVQIRSDDYFVSGSVAIFFVMAVCFVFALLFLVSLVIWIMRIPSNVRSALEDYMYRKKVARMLDIMYLVETGKIKEASRKYKERDLVLLEHPMVKLVKKKVEKYSEDEK